MSIKLDGQVATGVFNIADDSDDLEGAFILLTDYGVRWEFKKQGDPQGVTGTFTIDNTTADGAAVLVETIRVLVEFRAAQTD